MTFKKMQELLDKNNIPDDVRIFSNSGWECGATEVEAVYYSATKNEIHLVQKVYFSEEKYDEDSLMKESDKAHDWILLSE